MVLPAGRLKEVGFPLYFGFYSYFGTTSCTGPHTCEHSRVSLRSVPQTSCYMQALTARSTVSSNVCYNGPRAGLNYNDGFFGGYDVSHNLLFNHVRETADHGPFNSWDRQPYLTDNGVRDGFPPRAKPPGLGHASLIARQSHVHHNFIINGYSGVWAIDHDDGSQRYNDTANLMVWGGCKNFLGNSKSCDHNTMVYPGRDDRSLVWVRPQLPPASPTPTPDTVASGPSFVTPVFFFSMNRSADQPTAVTGQWLLVNHQVRAVLSSKRWCPRLFVFTSALLGHPPDAAGSYRAVDVTGADTTRCHMRRGWGVPTGPTVVPGSPSVVPLRTR